MIADWKHGPHLLTYRQTEYTFGLVADGPRQGRAGRAALAGAAGGLRRPAGGLRPGGVQGRQHVAGRGLDGPGVLLPAPAARHQRLRRPRGVLGTPQEQPAAQRGRAVLRLLPVRRDHDARGERARRPRARPPRHGVVVPARPGPRVRPRPDRDARRRASRSATSSPTPATPTATPDAWALPLAPPARSSSRTCTRTTAAPRAPTTAPSSPTATCTARAHPARCWNSGRCARTATSEQAAAHDAKTAELARYKLGRLTADDARRLPPRRLPGRHGQDPLPAAARLDEAGPGPAGDPPAPRSTPRPAARSRRSPSRRR